MTQLFKSNPYDKTRRLSKTSKLIGHLRSTNVEVSAATVTTECNFESKTHLNKLHYSVIKINRTNMYVSYQKNNKN